MGKKNTKTLANKDAYREFLFNTYKPLVRLNVKKKKKKQPNKKSAKE